jgi:hypothetical protein
LQIIDKQRKPVAEKMSFLKMRDIYRQTIVNMNNNRCKEALIATGNAALLKKAHLVSFDKYRIEEPK